VTQTWQEYLQEKQKLVEIQVVAVKQKTPAERLAFYLSASFPNWKLNPYTVRELDEAFQNRNFNGLYFYVHGPNYLVSAIAAKMLDEVALILAVQDGQLSGEKYQQAWWVENPNNEITPAL
jgi:hypothetical protein